LTLQEFANYGVAQGMRLAGTNIVGVLGGYPYNITLKSGKKADAAAVRFALSRAPSGKDRKALKALIPVGTRIAYIQNQILFTVSAAPEEIFRSTAAVITTAVDCFKNAAKPLVPVEKCFVCNKPGCDSAALSGDGVGALYQPAHAACVMEKSTKAAYKANKNEQSGNYLLGLIGALVGGLVGMIPNILLIVFLKVEVAYGYLLIPLAAFFGYKLLGGRMGNVTRISVILSSLIAFIVMQPMQYYVYSLKEGYSRSFLWIVDWYLSDLTINEILSNIWFGAIFLFIGLASAFSQIGRTNRDFISEANANVDSLISLHGEPIVPQGTTHSHFNPAEVGNTYVQEPDTDEHHAYDRDKPPMEIDI